MAIKPVDLSRLLSQLRASKTAVEDRPLAQVIEQLIKQSQFLTDVLNNIGNTGSSITNVTEIINNYMLSQSDGGDSGDGDIGPPGIQGIAGVAGIQGAAGPITIGPMGINGEDGEDGYPIPGQAGPQGPAGNNAPLTFLAVITPQTINAGAGVYTDVTGLTFAVVNGNTYGFKFYIVFQSAALTTGWKSSVNCPTGTLDFLCRTQTVTNSTTGGVATWLDRHSVTRDDMTTLTATVTANVDLIVMIEGRYICTADGTFAVRFANELTNTDITVQAGSWGMYWQQ